MNKIWTNVLAFLLVYGSLEYTCGTPSCSSCYSSTSCDSGSCSSGYYGDVYWDIVVPKLQCLACTPPCKTCNGNGVNCSSCIVNYGLKPSGWSKSCQPCPSNCKECYSDYTQCIFCNTGYGLTTSKTCLACGTHCDECFANYTICTKCSTDDVYTLDALGICGLCMTNCKDCSDNVLTCKKCNNKFGGPTCLACGPHCLQCDADAAVCEKCTSSYILDSHGICGVCVNECATCTTNVSYCDQCYLTYGLDIGTLLCNACGTQCADCRPNYTACVTCNTGYGISLAAPADCCLCGSHCLSCPTDCTKCKTCENGYGLDSSTSSICELCVDTHCLKCNNDSSSCTECAVGFGFNSSQLCESCESFCLECATVYTTCTLCQNDRLHGLNSGQCLPCLTECAECSYLDNTYCLSCVVGYYLDSNSCRKCADHCYNCISLAVCVECDDAYYLNALSACIGCPQYCATCNDTNIAQSVQNITCHSCVLGEFQLYFGETFRCRQLCGDSYTTTFGCDNQLGIQFDGCDNNCTVMDNFKCKVKSGITICSYNSNIQMEKVSFFRQKFQNKFTLVVKIVYPLLYTFISNAILTNMFKFNNKGVEMIKTTFDNTTNLIKFQASFSQDLVGQKLETAFMQPYVNDILNQFQLSNEIYQPYFYSPQTFMFAKILYYYCYFVVSISYFSLIINFVLKGLAGLQAIMVVQFSWLNALWMNSPLFLPFYQITPLKYSSGFNVNFFQQKNAFFKTENTGPPYTNYFQLSHKMFSTNFNLSILTLILPIIFFLICLTRIRLFIFANQNYNVFQKFGENQKISQQYSKLQKLFNYSCQLLLSSCMYNQIYFITCLIIKIKNGFDEDITSIIFISITIIAMVCIIVLFYVNPDPFDYFRYQFNPKFVRTRNHFFLQILFIAIVLVVLQIFPEFSFINFVPLTLMFLYVLIQKPYIQKQDNYRAAFNYFVMISFTLLKVFVQKIPQNRKQPIQLNQLFLVINVCVLLPCVVGLSVTTTFYKYFINQKINPIQQHLNYVEWQRKRRNMKVLMELNISKVNNKMKKNADDTTFKMIIPPQLSLKKSSNILCEEFQQKHQIQELNKEGQRFIQNNKCQIYIDGEYPTFSKRKIDKQSINTVQKFNKIRKGIQNQLILNFKKQNGKSKKNVTNTTNSTNQSYQIQNKKEEQQKCFDPQFVEVLEREDKEQIERQKKNQFQNLIEGYNQIAKKVLLQQNKLINWKGASEYVQDQKARFENNKKESSIFLKIYDQI